MELWGEDKRRALIDICGHIINNSLHVVGGFLKIPQFLVGASLVVQSRNNQESIDSFSTTCCVFQNLLRFLQINKPSIIVILAYKIYSHCVILDDSFYELLCIKVWLQSFDTNSSNWTLFKATLFCNSSRPGFWMGCVRSSSDPLPVEISLALIKFRNTNDYL